MELLNFGGCRWRRWSDENRFFGDERIPEKLRGCFIGGIYDVGSSAASSAQLNGPEMCDLRGSRWFWVNIGWFSTFWPFSIKSVEAWRVFEAETIMVDAKDSVGSFDLKTARERALFSCSVLAARCGELATVVGVEDWKMTSSGGSGLA